MERRLPLKIELVSLLVLILVAGGIWSFAEIAEEVTEGDTRQVDEAILFALRNPEDRSDPLGPAWVEEMERDFTALGGIPVLLLLTVAASTFLVLDGKHRAAVMVLVAVGGALLWSSLLKDGFQRPRPDLVPHGAHVYTASFPSAHSMMSAATYLTLGALLARVQPRRRLKIFLLVFAALLTFIVGCSRVYLGVHWPTDVLAGWTAGSVWALLCWLAARWLQRRGKVEAEGESRE
ncbi:MAG: phosphatase PAP2 family protein [Thermoanaerobaculia bacterium]